MDLEDPHSDLRFSRLVLLLLFPPGLLACLLESLSPSYATFPSSQQLPHNLELLSMTTDLQHLSDFRRSPCL